MGRAERVVHEDIGVRREGLRELRVVLLLLGVEAQVLEEQQLARLAAGDRVLGARRPSASPVTGTARRAARERRCATGRRRRRVLDLAVGPAQVTGEDDARALRRAGGGSWAATRGSAGSSVILPSSRGTLKSTRTKTRLPDASRSRTVSLSMVRSPRGEGRAPAGQAYAAREAGCGMRAPTKLMRSATRQL